MKKKLEKKKRKKRTVTISFEGPPDQCPKCQSTQIAPIIYGKMAPLEWIDDLPMRNGKVLGGCVFGDDSPTWVCVKCKHEGGHITHTVSE